MSATNSFENSILGLIFEATAIANIADDASSAPATNLYISLHTADPGETGDQATSETTYTGYARQTVSRDSSGWTVASGAATNDSEITFAQCTASPGNDITHVGIGLSSSGAGTLLVYGALDSAITMQVGSTPIFSAGQLEVTLD